MQQPVAELCQVYLLIVYLVVQRYITDLQLSSLQLWQLRLTTSCRNNTLTLSLFLWISWNAKHRRTKSKNPYAGESENKRDLNSAGATDVRRHSEGVVINGPDTAAPITGGFDKKSWSHNTKDGLPNVDRGGGVEKQQNIKLWTVVGDVNRLWCCTLRNFQHLHNSCWKLNVWNAGSLH